MAHVGITVTCIANAYYFFFHNPKVLVSARDRAIVPSSRESWTIHCQNVSLGIMPHRSTAHRTTAHRSNAGHDDHNRVTVDDGQPHVCAFYACQGWNAIRFALWARDGPQWTLQCDKDRAGMSRGQGLADVETD